MKLKFIILLCLTFIFNLSCSDSGGSSDSEDTSTDSLSDSDSSSDSTLNSDTGSDEIVDYSDCTFCHGNPPATFPHTDAQHKDISCNDPDCHGGMINKDGTALVDDTLHNNGTLNTTCGAATCHNRTAATCESCHTALPPDDSSHPDSHNTVSCNDPLCHGGMINSDGTVILDDTLHNNGTVNTTCNDTKCHSTAVTCESCHPSMPPDDSSHPDAHSGLGCNVSNCHGGMINSDGTAILDDTLHNNGTVDTTCKGCHSH